MLKDEINKASLKELKELLVKERLKLNLLPEKINILNFISVTIDVIARKKSIDYIDKILILIGIEKSPRLKDIRDSYE